MRIRLSLRRPDGTTVDLEATADATATVGELGRVLHEGDPEREHAGRTTMPSGAEASPSHAEAEGPRLSLRVVDGPSGEEEHRSDRHLPPERLLVDSGIRSGSLVEVIASTEDFDPAAGGADSGAGAAAVLRMHSGPSAGTEILLSSGATVLGTDPDADVRLPVRALPGVRVRVNVTSSIELIDLTPPPPRRAPASMGHDAEALPALTISGGAVSRAHLGPGQLARIAGIDISISPLRHSGDESAATAQIEINRSPRVVPELAPRELTAPTPPRPVELQPFPLLLVLAPLLMGAVVFAVTRSAHSLIFVAMMPIMVLAGYATRRLHERRVRETSVRRFHLQLAALERSAAAAQEVERAVRLAQSPSAAESADAILRHGPLLWTHRPEHPAFLTLRLGLGADDARTSIAMPGAGDADPEHGEALESAVEAHRLIERVPILADLRSAGSVGIAGEGERCTGAVRGILLQVMALHSPAEVVLAVLASERTRERWRWLTWAPHVANPHAPVEADLLTSSPEAAEALVSAIEDLITQRSSAGEVPRSPAFLLLIEDDAPIQRARLVRILERGPDAGVHALWMAGSTGALPAACRTFLRVSEGGLGALTGEVLRGRRIAPVQVEEIDPMLAEELARRLAPLVDAGALHRDATDLPREIPLLRLLGTDLAGDPRAVRRGWESTDLRLRSHEAEPVHADPDDDAMDRAAHLRAAVGHDGEGVLQLDLRAHGPHALVGGTTGSGKSEFLQTWVLALAAAHSPRRVSFLLVDYKGGSAFADCTRLPHTVGMVTDLTPALVRRALASLRAELQRRERLLHRARAKDLLTMERRGDPETPPSLVIVIDEFAALAADVPEFVDGVVDIAARGRSLGLHLILATQRPAGIVKDSLRANASLRIALRLADDADSKDVIGDALAARFPADAPGRAAVSTGPGRVTTFQAAFAGGWTPQSSSATAVTIRELGSRTAKPWRLPAERAPGSPSGTAGPNDITRIVDTLVRAAADAQIPPPRRPWLDALPECLDIVDLEQSQREDQLQIGRLDLPEEQTQPTLAYRPDVDGTLAVLGTGRSGKSTTLRSLAVASGIAALHGAPMQVYALDLAGGSLAALEELPHVGTVIMAEDEERITRLLRRLREEVTDRSARFAASRAATLAEHRRQAGEPALPRILLLVDGIGALRDALDTPRLADAYAALLQIAGEGRQVGVHLALAAERPGAVPAALAATIQKRIVHRPASDDECALLGVPRDVLTADSPPGRALLGRHEAQIAVPAGSAAVLEQSACLVRLGEEMRRAGTAAVPPVRCLPAVVEVTELLGPHDAVPAGQGARQARAPEPDPRSTVLLGMEQIELRPHGIRPSGSLMVAGSAGAGRTTALRTLAAQLAVHHPQIRRIRLGLRPSELAGTGLWDREATGHQECEALIEALGRALSRGEIPAGSLCLVIEALGDVSGTPLHVAADGLIRAALRRGHLVVGEGETSTWSQMQSLAQPFRSGRRGLILRPSEGDPESLLGSGSHRGSGAMMPPGRGVLIQDGRSAIVQIAITSYPHPAPASQSAIAADLPS